MYWQIDRRHGAVCGHLTEDPETRTTKDGRRMVLLTVAYGSVRVPSDDDRRMRNVTTHMPVCVYGEYTSYARLMSKGDCVLAIGRRGLKPPKGLTNNPMSVDKRNFGIILGTGTTRAFEIEVAAVHNNEVVQRIKGSKRQNKKVEDVSNDEFKDIKGDWY